MLAARGPINPLTLPITDAVGLVLDQDLIVPGPVPPQPIALRAGYAVASSDLVGASPYSPVPMTGEPPWLESGDALPPGFDAVVPRDAVEMRGPVAEILASCSPGENVRRAGEDAAAGSCLRKKGELLRDIDVALAGAAGVLDAVARRVRLRCRLDENSRDLSSLIADVAGARVEIETVTGGSFPCDTSGADLTLVISPRNHAGLLPSGVELLAPGLALRCAETVAIGIVDGVPIVIAPPRLDTAFALLCGLIRPYVDALSERRSGMPWRGSLTRKLSSTVGLMEVALVRETMGAVEPLSVGALNLSALARADGYVVIPPESEGFQSGDTVEICRVG